jgi:putative membrane protein
MRRKLALLALMTMGCRGSEAAERYDTSAAGRRDSIAAVVAASMNDSQVLALLRETHAADSALGALGAAQGSTNEMKDFGRMILREHHALNADANRLARDLGIGAEQLRVTIDAPPAGLRAQLDATNSGAAWDREFVDYAIAVHESAMENTARALAATRRPEIKAYITKSVPILQKHLDKARSLRKRNGSG